MAHPPILHYSYNVEYRSVPQIRPPFCNLSLIVENAGGAYTRDATISLAIRPSLPVKLDLIVGGVEAKHEASL